MTSEAVTPVSHGGTEIPADIDIHTTAGKLADLERRNDEAVHSGSSCSSEMLEPSPVLAAMGVDADHSLRVSVGWSTIDADIDRFVEVLPGIVERFRELRTA